MLQDRKILVTGGTGQIAGPIAEDFARHNEVWIAARFSNPDRKAQLEALGIKTCVWDMDTGDNSMLPDDFTHVVHSAINLSPDYDQTITNNAEGSALLMQPLPQSKSVSPCLQHLCLQAPRRSSQPCLC